MVSRRPDAALEAGVWGMLLRIPGLSVRPGVLGLALVVAVVVLAISETRWAARAWGSAAAVVTALASPGEAAAFREMPASPRPADGAARGPLDDRWRGRMEARFHAGGGPDPEPPRDGLTALLPVPAWITASAGAFAAVTGMVVTARRLRRVMRNDTIPTRRTRNLAAQALQASAGLLVLATPVAALAVPLWLMEGMPRVSMLTVTLMLVYVTGALVVAAVLAAAAPLMVAALVFEDAGIIDSVQRSVAYVIHRPIVTAAAFGAAGILVLLATEVVSRVVTAAAELVRVSLPPPATDQTTGAPMPCGGWLPLVWDVRSVMVDGAMVATILASGPAVYLMLRRVCDGQDVTDVVPLIPDVARTLSRAPTPTSLSEGEEQER